jgi:hypothetical protein
MEMIRFSVSKEKIEQQQKLREPLEEGFYLIECQGFEPKKSNDKQSINLNPKLVVIDRHNPPEGSLPLEDFLKGKKRLFDNLNENCWYQGDFCHAFGEYLIANEDDDLGLPGGFVGKNNAPPDPQNPETWMYVGPLIGKRAVVKVVPRTYNNKVSDAIDQYVCSIEGCQEQHSARLQKQ